MAIFCDLTNRLRNSAIFLPLLYFIIGATIYYSWSLTSQNTEVLMKLSMVNAALTATNGDLLKTNTKLKMCHSKESAFMKSNRDLQLSLSKKEDQTVQLNENLASETKSKQQFLNNFELLFKSMMSSEEFLKSDSLDSVFNNMQLIKKHFNAELERFNKEKVELQGEMKTKTTRLEDQLKIFDTQNNIFRQKLKECNTIITSLNDNIEELKHQQAEISQERGINIKSERVSSNVKMINLNNDKPSEEKNRDKQMPKINTNKISQTTESPITDSPEIYITKSIALDIEKKDEEMADKSNKTGPKVSTSKVSTSKVSYLKKNTSNSTELKSTNTSKNVQAKKEKKQTEAESKEAQSTRSPRKDDSGFSKQPHVLTNNKNNEATLGRNLEESSDEENGKKELDENEGKDQNNNHKENLSKDKADEVETPANLSEDKADEVETPANSSEDKLDEVETPPKSSEDKADEVETPANSSEDKLDEVETPPKSSEDKADEVETPPS